MNKLYFCVCAFFFALQASAQTPCVDGMAGIYPCQNMDLLKFVPLSAIGSGANTNDIWGWVSPVTQKEYALVGCSNGSAFLDISDPLNPVEAVMSEASFHAVPNGTAALVYLLRGHTKNDNTVPLRLGLQYSSA